MLTKPYVSERDEFLRALVQLLPIGYSSRVRGGVDACIAPIDRGDVKFVAVMHWASDGVVTLSFTADDEPCHYPVPTGDPELTAWFSRVLEGTKTASWLISYVR